MFLQRRNPTGEPAGLIEPSFAWWTSTKANIIKYSLLGLLAAILVAWVLIGSIHARRRVARGQAPLRYHRWLVPSSARPNYWQHHSAVYYRRTEPQTSRVDPDAPPQYTADMPPPTYQPPAKKESFPQEAIPLPSYAELVGESSRDRRSPSPSFHLRPRTQV